MKKVIPSAQVQHKVHIVHDCFDGHCKFEDESHTFLEEWEVVEHNKFAFGAAVIGNSCCGFPANECISMMAK
jgi:hypothetical protein